MAYTATRDQWLLPVLIVVVHIVCIVSSCHTDMALLLAVSRRRLLNCLPVNKDPWAARICDVFYFAFYSTLNVSKASSAFENGLNRSTPSALGHYRECVTCEFTAMLAGSQARQPGCTRRTKENVLCRSVKMAFSELLEAPRSGQDRSRDRAA